MQKYKKYHICKLFKENHSLFGVFVVFNRKPPSLPPHHRYRAAVTLPLAIRIP